MPNPPANPNAATEGVMVPFERVAALVRHLTHEIRNGLNTIDLQASLLQELVPAQDEAAPEVKRIRSIISGTAKTLHGFSASFTLAEPQMVTYAAKLFMEDFRARLLAVLGEKAALIEWTDELGAEQIAIDIEMIFRAFSKFFKNAFYFHEKDQPIAARTRTVDGRFILELREGKTAVPSPPQTWGREPLVTTRRSGFGIGLFHARRILAAHEGTVEITFDPVAKLLTTRLSLPLAPG